MACHSLCLGTSMSSSRSGGRGSWACVAAYRETRSCRASPSRRPCQSHSTATPHRASRLCSRQTSLHSHGGSQGSASRDSPRPGSFASRRRWMPRVRRDSGAPHGTTCTPWGSAARHPPPRQGQDPTRSSARLGTAARNSACQSCETTKEASLHMAPLWLRASVSAVSCSAWPSTTGATRTTSYV